MRRSPNATLRSKENDKLLMILSQYKRTIFGPRSETLDPGQLSLFTITTQAARAATTT
jgi:hypothetical protein